MYISQENETPQFLTMENYLKILKLIPKYFNSIRELSNKRLIAQIHFRSRAHKICFKATMDHSLTNGFSTSISKLFAIT